MMGVEEYGSSEAEEEIQTVEHDVGTIYAEEQGNGHGHAIAGADVDVGAVAVAGETRSGEASTAMDTNSSLDKDMNISLETDTNISLDTDTNMGMVAVQTPADAHDIHMDVDTVLTQGTHARTHTSSRALDATTRKTLEEGKAALLKEKRHELEGIKEGHEDKLLQLYLLKDGVMADVLHYDPEIAKQNNTIAFQQFQADNHYDSPLTSGTTTRAKSAKATAGASSSRAASGNAGSSSQSKSPVAITGRANGRSTRASSSQYRTNPSPSKSPVLGASIARKSPSVTRNNASISKASKRSMSIGTASISTRVENRPGHFKKAAKNKKGSGRQKATKVKEEPEPTDEAESDLSELTELESSSPASPVVATTPAPASPVAPAPPVSAPPPSSPKESSPSLLLASIPEPLPRSPSPPPFASPAPEPLLRSPSLERSISASTNSTKKRRGQSRAAAPPDAVPHSKKRKTTVEPSISADQSILRTNSSPNASWQDSFSQVDAGAVSVAARTPAKKKGIKKPIIGRTGKRRKASTAVHDELVEPSQDTVDGYSLSTPIVVDSREEEDDIPALNPISSFPVEEPRKPPPKLLIRIPRKLPDRKSVV